MLLQVISPSAFFGRTLRFYSREVMAGEQCAKKLKLDVAETIKEGKAEILVAEKNVFYNPVQEFNRDLSIAVLTVFSKEKSNDVQEKNITSSTRDNAVNANEVKDETKKNGITILDALSATGLRSIRYAKEIPGVKKITANDISAKAVESIKKNTWHNQVEGLIEPSHEDATIVMYKNKKRYFDVVDLDPYGCPSIFLDGAVQCVSEGGVLLVTATDMAVLAGNSPETCYLKYGAISLKTKSCHEMALRILLQSIAAHAGRYGRYIVPLLSVSADFYIRVFVRVFTSQLKCKENASKMGLVYHCTGCESMHFQPLGIKKPNSSHTTPNSIAADRLCEYCQSKQHVGGPIWLGSLHDKNFVEQILNNLDEMELGTKKRIRGILVMIHEELDLPLYYVLDRLMSIVKCTIPPILSFRSALLNAGYKVSYSHAHKCSVKTDAPNNVIWDIVRAWEKEQPAKRDSLAPNSPAYIILNTPSTTDVSFTIHPDANPVSRQQHMSRFQMNPAVNWGPGTRARTMIRTDMDDTRRVRNQNKNSKKREGETKNEENNSEIAVDENRST